MTNAGDWRPENWQEIKSKLGSVIARRRRDPNMMRAFNEGVEAGASAILEAKAKEECGD